MSQKRNLKESTTTSQVDYILATERGSEEIKKIKKSTFDAQYSVTSSNGGPQIYKAIVSQGSTNAPYEDDLAGGATGSPFVDTLGGTWSYNTTGTFYYTKTGAFSDITKINVELPYNNGSNQAIDTVIYWNRLNADTLRFYTGTSDSYLSPSVITLANSKMYLQPITIEVYP